jgi:hypothetical protein
MQVDLAAESGAATSTGSAQGYVGALPEICQKPRHA